MGVTSVIDKVMEPIDNLWDSAGKFLDDNPEVYKLYTLSLHIFRAVPMFALMAVSPLPPAVGAGLMIGGSLIYWVGIERRVCSFKFVLPSTFGGIAMWACRASLINVLSGGAFESLASTLIVGAGIGSLVVYSVWAYYQSSKDVDDYLAKKNHCRYQQQQQQQQQQQTPSRTGHCHTK